MICTIIIDTCEYNKKEHIFNYHVLSFEHLEYWDRRYENRQTYPKAIH